MTAKGCGIVRIKKKEESAECDATVVNALNEVIVAAVEPQRKGRHTGQRTRHEHLT